MAQDGTVRFALTRPERWNARRSKNEKEEGQVSTLVTLGLNHLAEAAHA